MTSTIQVSGSYLINLAQRTNDYITSSYKKQCVEHKEIWNERRRILAEIRAELDAEFIVRVKNGSFWRKLFGKKEEKKEYYNWELEQLVWDSKHQHQWPSLYYVDWSKYRTIANRILATLENNDTLVTISLEDLETLKTYGTRDA